MRLHHVFFLGERDGDGGPEKSPLMLSQERIHGTCNRKKSLACIFTMETFKDYIICIINTCPFSKRPAQLSLICHSHAFFIVSLLHDCNEFHACMAKTKSLELNQTLEEDIHISRKRQERSR